MKKRKNGLYEKTVTINGVRKHIYGKTQAEISRKMQELYQQPNVLSPETTFQAYSTHWLEIRNLRPNTRYYYTNAIKHLNNHIGYIPISKIRLSQLTECLNKFEDRPALRNRMLKLYRSIIKSAIADDLAVKDVSVNISTLNYRQAEKRPLTDVEKEIVLSMDNWDGLAMRIMYYTGMRAGEVMGLAWADIKSDGIHVTHNRTNYGIGELKTQSSYRIIPIPEQLRNELNSVKKSGVYVFSHENGKVRTVSSLEYNIKQKVGVSSHYLRHNYATMLYASGVDLKTAQHLLGHSSLKMTMDIYTHLDQEKKNNSIEKLMKHFG